MPDTSGHSGIEHFEEYAATRRNTSDEGKYATYETIQGTAGDGSITIQTRHVAEYDPAAPVLEVEAAAGGSLAAAEYFYAVEAVGAYGAGPLSNEEAITISGTVNNSVDLTWNNSPGATEYNVYAGTVSATYDRDWTTSDSFFTDDGS